MDAETWKLVVDTAQAGAAIFGGLSAGFAGWAIWKSSKERKNAHLLNHAKTSIERAFSALFSRVDAVAPPPSDRVAWLTAARLIEEYRRSKARIQDPLTLEECESHEAHWSHQFYIRLQPLSNTVPEYYGQPGSATSIPPVAAIIVHDFAIWPEEKPDPLKSHEVSKRKPHESDAHLRWGALRAYIRLINRP